MSVLQTLRRELTDQLGVIDGKVLNYEVVKELAWFGGSERYASKDATLEGLEFQAREARLGLWSDPNPVQPWECRRNKPAPFTETG